MASTLQVESRPMAQSTGAGEADLAELEGLANLKLEEVWAPYPPLLPSALPGISQPDFSNACTRVG